MLLLLWVQTFCDKRNNLPNDALQIYEHTYTVDYNWIALKYVIAISVLYCFPQDYKYFLARCALFE